MHFDSLSLIQYRFKDYCQKVMAASKELPISDAERGAFRFKEGAAFIVEASSVTHDLLTDVCTSNKCNFTGAALAIIDTTTLEEIDGDVCI